MDFGSQAGAKLEASWLEKSMANLSKKAWDDLRFTNLSALKKNDFRISEVFDAPKKNFKYPEAVTADNYKIVFNNGHYQKQLTTLPKGIEIFTNLEYYDNRKNKVAQPTASPWRPGGWSGGLMKYNFYPFAGGGVR